MTASRRFEQDLPALIADTYLAGTPDYRDDLIGLIAGTPQRPAWRFPGRWLPVDLVTERVSSPRVPWRALATIALIALLIAAGAAAYVGSRPPLPAPFGVAANGRLVYNADGDVFIRDGLDAPSRVIMGGPTTDSIVGFSPRGDRLLLARDTNGSFELFVAAADGAGPKRIGGPYVDPGRVEWSPDGSQIAVSHAPGGLKTVVIVAADGSGERTLDIGMPAEDASWRPPLGQQLLIRGQLADGWALHVVDAAGGTPRRLALDEVRLDGGEYDSRGASWSPTGDRILYESLEPLPGSQLGTEGLRLHVASIDPAGVVSTVSRLESDPFDDDELNGTFTPNGQRIVFQRRLGWTPPDPSTGTPTVDALLITAADGTGTASPLGVSSTNGDGLSYTLSPDGRSVIAHLWKEGQDWIIDLDGGAPRLADFASLEGVSWQRVAVP
jgi:dipeptidyl aminopeptidase/acylaminoacyl peptidase